MASRVPGYNPVVDKLRESPTRRIDRLRERLAREGRDIILLSTGQPGIPPPRWVRERLREALIEESMRLYGYTPSPGRASLLEAIARDVSELGGFEIGPDQVVATAGGQEALYATLQAVLRPGDGVVVLDPMYFGYWPLLDYYRARVTPLRLSPDDGYRVDGERLAALVEEARPRAVVLVTPDNPTGRVLDRSVLTRVADAVERVDAWLIVDEAYRTLVYEGEHVYAYPLAPENVIAVGTFSKDPGIPGWRLGYVYGPKWIVSKIRLLSEEIVYCPPSPAQFLVETYLSDREARARNIERLKREYTRRRDALVEAVRRHLPRARMPVPRGGMFALVDLSPYLAGKNVGSEELARMLLEEESVAVVPGAYFGETARHAIRLSYATEPPERIREGVERIARLLARLQHG